MPGDVKDPTQWVNHKCLGLTYFGLPNPRDGQLSYRAVRSKLNKIFFVMNDVTKSMARVKSESWLSRVESHVVQISDSSLTRVE